jgi:hypothetical protein
MIFHMFLFTKQYHLKSPVVDFINKDYNTVQILQNIQLFDYILIYFFNLDVVLIESMPIFECWLMQSCYCYSDFFPHLNCMLILCSLSD